MICDVICIESGKVPGEWSHSKTINTNIDADYIFYFEAFGIEASAQ